MDDDQQFCLRWNNHQSTLISVFDTLLENETLVDCTLAAEGKFLKAHKVVLSACSPYFATLLQEQYDKHPIFILKDVKYQELRAMMDYMYRGEVNISQDQLAALLKAAESLQIKGLSDNRTGGGAAPKPESSGQHHRGGKLSGAYTLEQTKRARLATGGAMDASGDVSGSREGSSSPSRRRRKVRRRSMENDAHDNSNSSVLQAAASNQSILQQTGAGLAVSALVSTQLSSGPAAGSQASSTQQQQPLTSTNVTKKTESAKLTSSTAAPASGASASAASVQQAHLQQQAQTTSDAINTENVQAQSQGGAQGVQGDDEDMDEGSAVGGASVASGTNPASASASAVHAGVVVKQLASVVDKSSSNHKQKIKDNSVSSVGSEMVIEPKAEYDDDAHDENVEDLTLDEEDMTMEELDQTAGTSQGGEGSSQTYATWQHDRSQDELGLLAQDAQQRDPQGLQLIDDSSSSQQNHLNGSKLELMDGSSDDFHQGTGSLHHFQAPQFDHFHGLLAGGNGLGGAGGGGLEESFTCPQCYRTYRRHGTLRRHLRQECGKGKSMVCSVCGHRTKRADHLRQHVRKKHPEIAMRSLFKRQQRAAAAAASSAEGEEHKPGTEIVDLVDMLDEAAVAAVDEDHQHAYLVEDDDEDELHQQQQPSSHIVEETTTSSYYRQQLRQQALLQQALQQVAAAAAVVASGSSSTSSAELLKGEGL
ncbi:longitudinals lacking protein, isoforms H/M/V isoform X8 [Drosophila takahashii]|uniref:longitudinals lacking protein, isoforms H/M/V isoform X8 n=1 Tax=Drosophila takahashii TaxID=29030 RepID=UPI001CF900FE|nr:longitudinals lacking protein, isoforms H/M/V isoform X8 [Drosophila takahashii]